MTITIIADGEFPQTEYPRYLISSADAVVCCDGAVDKYLEFSQGVAPDAIVGDMDSLSAELKQRFNEIIVKYEEQDYNDLDKAVRYVVEKYPSTEIIHIIAASGKQEDFTIGNYGLLMKFCQEHPNISFDAVSDFCTAFPLCDSCEFDCGEGRTVSVFSPDPSLRIHSRGLQWQLDEVCFDNWWKGIRNRACDDQVSLEFNHTSMALIILN